MIQPTTGAPRNDYDQDDLDAEASEEAPPPAPCPWRMILCLLAVPVALVIGMLWAVGAI